jgi:hypothetical protein
MVIHSQALFKAEGMIPNGLRRERAAGPIVEMNNRRDGTREMLNSLRSKRVRDGQLVPPRPASLDRPPLPTGGPVPVGRTCTSPLQSQTHRSGVALHKVPSCHWTS